MSSTERAETVELAPIDDGDVEVVAYYIERRDRMSVGNRLRPRQEARRLLTDLAARRAMKEARG